MKQRFLADLRCLASKPRVFITNLIALLRESIKLVTTGRKPTKRCISCGVKLKEGVNWWKSFVGKNHYKCMDCYAIRREENKRKKLQREGK
jgi:tRNA(Ile2) C34 agmatinyltransferase TiaS